MSVGYPGAAGIGHIEALLDDPMVSLIMKIDHIDRADAKQLFEQVAYRLSVGTSTHSKEESRRGEGSIFFSDQRRPLAGHAGG